MSRIEQAKKEVLEAAKKAFQAQLFAGTSGNLSIYIPEENAVVITPSSVRYEGMTIADIVVIDLDGKVLEGRHKPSSEHLLHLALYRGGEAVTSVVHTHSPYATAFAVNNKEIPLILVEMIPFLGGNVKVAPIAPAGSPEVGAGAVTAIEGRYACLLGNHGVVTIGTSIDEAYLRAEYVEDAAKICSLAMSNGEINLVPPEIEKVMRGE